jgi:hypothetical protein
MTQTHDKDEGYLNGSFVWSSKHFGEFYSFTMKLLHREFQRFFVNLADFNDIYNDTMLKFGRTIEGRDNEWIMDSPKKTFYTTNRNGYTAFRIMFRNRMINEYQRHQKLSGIKKIIKSHPTCNEDSLVLNTSWPATMADVFNATDIQINKGEIKLAPRQTEFYRHYRIALLGCTNDKEIQTIVMREMQISKWHYWNLKSEIIAIFRKVLNKTNLID